MLLIRKLLILWRIAASGTRNFFRNAWLSIAATAVMVVTLTIMLSAVVFNMALGSTLDQITEQIDIAVFFEDDAVLEDIKKLDNRLQELENVTKTHYVSKEEALERYQKDNEGNEEVLEAINEEDNPLPRSIEIQVKELQKVDEIVILTQEDEFLPIVESTSLEENNRRRTVNRIANVRDSLVTFGITASSIFAIISVLIIFNTIRMAIFARGQEIGIMRLVGATNMYIRGPFLFEAMLDGVIAAIISLALVYAVLFRGGVGLLDYVDFGHTLAFFSDMWPLVVFGTILAGILIGVVSSMLAMVRYLKL